MKREEHFLDALARLEAQQRTAKPNATRPVSLRIADIKMAPAVFQPRIFHGGREHEEAHVKELTRALRSSKNRAPLPHILVIRIGRQTYCVDGHHRLAAYKAAGWTAEVPVEWFERSIREAAQEAIVRNSHDKLPMNRREKLEAAWRLVVLDDGLAKADIVRLTTVSNGTVGNMRQTLERLREEHASEPAEIDEHSGEASKTAFECRLTWAQVKDRNRDVTEWDEAKDERIISEWADKLGKAFGREWGRQPQLAARAIERYAPRLPRKIAEAWQEDGIIEGGDEDE